MTQPTSDHEVVIVVLSKYPDLFSGLQDNLNQFAPGFDRVLVKDGLMIDNDQGWKVVQGPPEFSYAHNVNLGLSAVHSSSDVFLIGDDVRLKDEGTIPELRNLAYSDERIGILSPKIIGAADNPLQTNPPTDRDIVYSDRYIATVCTYIKRSVIEMVGLMDSDSFGTRYGYDDTDFSRRTVLTGFTLAVAPRVEVIHGVKRKGAESFLRNVKGYSDLLKDQDRENEQAYIRKWGDNKKENW